MSLTCTTLIYGCEYTPSNTEMTKQSIDDYNMRIKAIDSNYSLSLKSAKSLNAQILDYLRSEGKEGVYLKNNMDNEILLNNLKDIKKAVKELNTLKDFNSKENEMYSELSSYIPDNSLANFNFKGLINNYVKVYYFKDMDTGKLEQYYIVTLPKNGYTGVFSLTWSGGEVLSVEEYSTNN